jgi:hypothetical protein
MRVAALSGCLASGLAAAAIAGIGAPALSAVQPQDEAANPGPADAVQIGDTRSGVDRPTRARSVFVEQREALTQDRTVGEAQPDLDQIPRMSTLSDADLPDTQISPSGERGFAMAQLSKVELDATLSQLSAAERRVLFDAIEGTDICENPPDVPAILALCSTRIETLPREYEPTRERVLTAEETLLNGSVDGSISPSLEQVIDRLSRTRAASDDFSNQAIASVALSPPPAIGNSGEENGGDADTLAPGTQELINAIINQLSGSGGP